MRSKELNSAEALELYTSYETESGFNAWLDSHGILGLTNGEDNDEHGAHLLEYVLMGDPTDSAITNIIDPEIVLSNSGNELVFRFTRRAGVGE